MSVSKISCSCSYSSRKGYVPSYPEEIANAVGAMATLVRGDMEGFPTRSQVNQFMGKTDIIDR
ncbi:hypothetical protein [Dethiosulfatibacter aminovorans]|uniref:hypothetical protein n=1 Tax=Dethiosulfatibacter aminovorans TaxID=332095 RepID=UPI0009329922|nr:hypothetical protein [Dethiosulfatibacter aminovorans]